MLCRDGALGPPGRAQTVTLDLPPAWAELIASLAAAPWRRLVVLGGTDVGKSSFCCLLCGQLANQGQSVALLDADLGQKVIGPPACVSLARSTTDGSLELERIRFVGEVSRAVNMTAAVAATARLASASEANRLVVNTSGLVTGPGVALKRWKLDALDPDLVVAIARLDELAPLLTAVPLDRIRILRPSSMARRKNPARRERNRRENLLTALGDCRPVSLPSLVVEDLHRVPPAPGVFRLCGFADRTGEDRALGLVRWSDYLVRQEVCLGPIDFTPHRMRLGMRLSDLGNVPEPFQPDPT